MANTRMGVSVGFACCRGECVLESGMAVRFLPGSDLSTERGNDSDSE